MFFNIDERSLEKYGDAKAYESNNGYLTSLVNICKSEVTTRYPGVTIDEFETYYNEMN